MKNLAFLISAISFFQIGLVGQSTWSPVNGIDPSVSVVNLEFTNIDYGVMLDDMRQVQLTPNGSDSWEPNPYGSQILRNIKFVGNDVWVVGNQGIAARGSIVNNAINWVPIVTNTNNNLRGLHFIDPQIGWIVGDNGTIRFTENGGATWANQSVVGLSANFTDIATDGAIAVIVSSSAQYAISNNGGKTWLSGGNLPITNCTKLVFYEGLFYALSPTQGIITSNNGVNWNFLSTPITEINGFDFRENKMYIVGNGGESYVSGGFTPGWDEIIGVPATVDIRDVACVPNGCYAGGSGGNMYFLCEKISIGGKVWGDIAANCTLDNSENGYANIQVDLLTPAGQFLESTTTNDQGEYEFFVNDNSSYRVSVPTGGKLFNNTSCGTATDPNLDIKGDQNGAVSGNSFVTDIINVKCGDEPGTNGVVNNTIDIGLTYNCGAGLHPDTKVNCSPLDGVCNFNDIDNGCHSLNDVIGTGSIGCNFSQSEGNLTWMTFTAGVGTYDLNIEIEGCFPGTSGLTGFKVGILPDCNANQSIYCEDFCGQGTSASISSTNFVPGNIYHLWIDGCDGGVCGVSYSVTPGYSPFVIPQPTTILIDNNPSSVTKCPGFTSTIAVSNGSTNYGSFPATYTWSIDKNSNTFDNFTTTSFDFTYDFDDVGVYDICLTKVSNDCGEQIVNVCNTYNVIELADEDFGLVLLCENKIATYSGPTNVNDDPTLTSDPNGDGFDGWYVPNYPFVLGTNTVNVTDANGCEYTQTVIINALEVSDPAIVQEVVCDNSEYPLYIGDQNYFSPVNNLLVTIPEFADNGCDSLIDITIYEIIVEGDIVNSGCGADGVRLEFVPTAGNQYITDVVWRNSGGGLIPDDGDGDIYTTTVPTSTDNYTATVTSAVAGLRSCEYVFQTTVSFEQPEIMLDDFVCIGDETTIVLSIPSGITTPPLWNFDGGELLDSFALDTPLGIRWNTVGSKSIVLAYIKDGCYIEESVPLVVLPKYVESDFSCLPSANSVTFTWPPLPNNTVGNINVISGQSGTLNGNSFIVEDLTAGESVTVEFEIDSPICNDYSIIAVCAAEPCSGISALQPFNSCSEAFGSAVCDFNPYLVGCSSLNAGSVVDPNIDCFTSDSFNVTYIPFTAWQGEYLITVDVFNCDQGLLNDGMEYAVLQSCDQVPVDCSNGCSEEVIRVSSSNLLAGEEYVLVLNGCNSTICDININVLGAVNTFQLPEVNAVTVNGSTDSDLSLCTGEDLVATVNTDDTTGIGGVTYEWVLTDLDNMTINSLELDGPSLSIDNISQGNYTLCFKDITHPCEDKDYQEQCFNITVQDDLPPIQIGCKSETTSINFFWQTDSSHNGYQVEVLTGQTGTLNGGEFSVVNLSPQEVVTIAVSANNQNSCNPVVDTLSCQAINCPDVDITIDYGGPLYFCLTDSLPFIDFTPIINPATQGTGSFSGTGVIDGVQGIWDPNLAGLGTHLLTYNFTSDGGCTYTNSIELIVIKAPEVSFVTNETEVCTNDEITITFTGQTGSSATFMWDFAGASIISGTGEGPYVISFDEAGMKSISLTVQDSVCTSEVVSVFINVDACTSCICPDLIDLSINCTTVFDPVCGCDGVTYNNSCEAQFYGGVKTWQKGPCNNTAADTIRAVCDDDNPNTINDTYNDECICEGEIIDGTVDAQLEKIHLFPNPTTGVVNITGYEGVTLQVYNKTGSLILKSIETKQLNLSHLPSGLYFVKFGELGYKKLLIIKQE